MLRFVKVYKGRAENCDARTHAYIIADLVYTYYKLRKFLNFFIATHGGGHASVLGSNANCHHAVKNALHDARQVGNNYHIKSHPLTSSAHTKPIEICARMPICKLIHARN